MLNQNVHTHVLTWVTKNRKGRDLSGEDSHVQCRLLAQLCISSPIKEGTVPLNKS